MMKTKWTVEFKPKALKEIQKLDKKPRHRIFHFLDSLIEDFDSPRQVGTAMKGDLKGLWRYRVGNYRIVCQLKDDVLTILIAKVDHRKDVYKH